MHLGHGFNTSLGGGFTVANRKENFLMAKARLLHYVRKILASHDASDKLAETMLHFP